MKKSARVLIVLGILALGACSSNSDTPRSQQQRSDPPQELSGEAGTAFSAAGFEFRAPEGWVPIPLANDMRKASFEYGPLANDSEKAELHCYYFGVDQGGGVEANIQRWIGQVTMAEGEEAERESFSASGYPVHLVSASGSYARSIGGPMSGKTESMAGWRLVGAVLEGAQGNLFFRLTGPEATVRAMEPGMRTMLEQLNKVRE